jgi:hypothetical protein
MLVVSAHLFLKLITWALLNFALYKYFVRYEINEATR